MKVKDDKILSSQPIRMQSTATNDENANGDKNSDDDLDVLEIEKALQSQSIILSQKDDAVDIQVQNS